MTNFHVTLALSLVLPLTSAMSYPSLRLAVVKADAAAAAHLKTVEEHALLQEDAGLAHEVGSNARTPNSADWFGDFSQGESTFTYDGTLAGRTENPALNVLDGWNPDTKDLSSGQVKDASWFASSVSGAQKMAFQDHPPLTSTIGGNERKTGDWFVGRGGALQQDYVRPATLEGRQHAIPASWFDGSVEQLDGYGRPKYPGYFSYPQGSGVAGENGVNFLEWEERSINTSLTCEKPGCTANVSLAAPFNPETEMSKSCHMSVFFHPTDFDDEYSGEKVEFVNVNDKAVSSNCRPFVNQGCNATAQRPLIACVSELPIDMLMPENGKLSISAKIPTVVDECPYNGNLLSAVPVVTCLVSPKPKPGPQPAKPVKAFFELENRSCVMSMPLQCATRGCAAEIAIPFGQQCTINDAADAANYHCKLSINVSQTDFDGSEGTPELIEYIKVDKKQVASQLKPGHNPCKDKCKGSTNSTNASRTFVALKDHAVNLSSGVVLVEGKISEYVDECASNGYLFDAVAEVRCEATIPKKASTVAEGAVAAGAAEATGATGATGDLGTTPSLEQTAIKAQLIQRTTKDYSHRLRGNQQ